MKTTTNSSRDTPAVDPAQPAFLRVPVECIPTVIEALKTAGFAAAAEAVADFTRYYTDPECNARRLRWLALARDSVAGDGDVEFDQDAALSENDEGNGQYVMGWVWVDGDESDTTTDKKDMNDEKLDNFLQEATLAVYTIWTASGGAELGEFELQALNDALTTFFTDKTAAARPSETPAGPGPLDDVD